MSEVWVEVMAGSIRGDRDGLVTLRSLINDALSKGVAEYWVEDEGGRPTLVKSERVGP